MSEQFLQKPKEEEKLEGGESIKDWTLNRLLRLIQDVTRDLITPNPTYERVAVTESLSLDGDLIFNLPSQTTVGSAGSATALPANPQKYIKIVDETGTQLVIPAYKAR